MDYSKLHWVGDFMSTEMYGEDVDDFVVGVYTLADFPNITVHVNTEIGEIIEAYVETE